MTPYGMANAGGSVSAYDPNAQRQMQPQQGGGGGAGNPLMSMMMLNGALGAGGIEGRRQMPQGGWPTGPQGTSTPAQSGMPGSYSQTGPQYGGMGMSNPGMSASLMGGLGMGGGMPQSQMGGGMPPQSQMNSAYMQGGGMPMQNGMPPQGQMGGNYMQGGGMPPQGQMGGGQVYNGSQGGGMPMDYQALMGRLMGSGPGLFPAGNNTIPSGYGRF